MKYTLVSIGLQTPPSPSVNYLITMRAFSCLKSELLYLEGIIKRMQKWEPSIKSG